MRWQGKFSLGLAFLMGAPLATFAQTPNDTPPQAPKAPAAEAPLVPNAAVPAYEPAAAPASAPLGPTPLQKVNILQGLLFGDDEKAPIHVSGWMDFDYTYRSTGHGRNDIAPVMNRFGDEALIRQRIRDPVIPRQQQPAAVEQTRAWK